MRGFTSTALAALVLSCAIGVGAASARSASPCQAGKATGTAGCTRAWVAAGCNQFIPLVKSVTGATSVAAKKVALRNGKNDLDCSFTYGDNLGFGFLYVSAGYSPAQFAANVHNTGQFTMGCLASASSDPTTATPAPPVKMLAGMGDQAAEMNQCPSGWVAAGTPGSTSDTWNVSAFEPSVLVRRGATGVQFSGSSATIAKTIAFGRKFLAKYS